MNIKQEELLLKRRNNNKFEKRKQKCDSKMHLNVT